MIYAFSVELHSSFDEALEEVRKAISQEGLGIVSEVDVQGVMRAKITSPGRNCR